MTWCFGAPSQPLVPHPSGSRGSATLHPPGSVSRARKITQPFVIAATDSAAAAVNLARRAIRREPAYPGLVRLMRQFYAGIGEGTPGPIPPADTLAVAEAWDAIAAITGFREPTTES